MPLIARLESKFGRFAVPNLTVILIAGQVLCYVAQYLQGAGGNGNVLDNLYLDPQRVAEGQVWRLVTYLFDPPRTNILFAFFGWYLFYLMGTTLETTWGAFRYNLFLLIGYLASLALAMLAWLLFAVPGPFATNLFLYGSVFLAFARLYPDFTILVFFILPVKIKWLALITWIGYGYSLLFDPWWLTKAMVLASILNYLLFFGRDIYRDARQGHRRMQHQARTIQTPSQIVHECHVCGLNSKDAPRTSFRYCSQCKGSYCYCPEHLKNHEHVTKEQQSA